LKHKVPTCGFLFIEHHRDKESRKRYAYCSDTAYCEKIVDQIVGVDVLFHEATYTEKDVDKCKKHTHSTAKQAAQIAKMAGVGKLIIGHFSAREDDHAVFLNEAKEVFDKTVLAVEKEKIEI
jgi:ribonuclease Z